MRASFRLTVSENDPPPRAWPSITTSITASSPVIVIGGVPPRPHAGMVKPRSRFESWRRGSALISTSGDGDDVQMLFPSEPLGP